MAPAESRGLRVPARIAEPAAMVFTAAATLRSATALFAAATPAAIVVAHEASAFVATISTAASTLEARAAAPATIVIVVTDEPALLIAVAIAALEASASAAVVFLLEARTARFLPALARGFGVAARFAEPSASLATTTPARTAVVVVVVAAASTAEFFLATATVVVVAFPAALEIGAAVVAATIHPTAASAAALEVSFLVAEIVAARLPRRAIVTLAVAATSEPVVLAGFAFAHEAAAIVARRFRVAAEIFAIVLVVAPPFVATRAAAESSFRIPVASSLTCHCNLLCR
jgi:hypothetical protein